MKAASSMGARLRALILACSMLLAGCVMLDPQYEITGMMTEGQQLYSAQRFDEAIARFRAATARDPNFYPAYVWLARSFIAKGLWPDAVLNARRAYQINPGGPDVLPVLLDALLGGGNEALARGLFVDSIGYFSEYLKHQPTNIRAWINVGKAYAANRQFLDALNALKRAIDSGAGGGERTEVLQSMLGAGKQALGERDYGSAINLLREYLRFNNSDWSAWLELGKGYWQSGSMRDALSAFSEVLRLNPRNSEALNFLQGR